MKKKPVDLDVSKVKLRVATKPITTGADHDRDESRYFETHEEVGLYTEHEPTSKSYGQRLDQRNGRRNGRHRRVSRSHSGHLRRNYVKTL